MKCQNFQFVKTPKYPWSNLVEPGQRVAWVRSTDRATPLSPPLSSARPRGGSRKENRLHLRRHAPANSGHLCRRGVGANHSSHSPLLPHRRNWVHTPSHGRAQPNPPRVRLSVSPPNCFFPDLMLAMAMCRALRSMPPRCGGVVLNPPCAPSNGSASTASLSWSYNHG